MLDAIQQLDQSVLLFIQESIRADWLDTIMLFITRLGDAGFIWIVLGLVMLFSKKTRRGGVIMLICLAVAFLLNDFVLKPLVARPRPYETVPELLSLLRETSYSFPSGHSNASFAGAAALAMVFGRRGAWTFIPAALIALSRCYVGVHYPTDILAGAAFGSLVAVGVCLLIFKIEKTRRT